MTSASYSFLDIAVLDTVRERFAAGEAVVILSTDLSEILWTNGTGAKWLGYSDIEAAIGNAPKLPAVALRQIVATPGFPHVGHDRHIALRYAAGLKSRIIDLQASTIVLPRGEDALLLTLAVPSATSGPAERTIEGFSEPGHFAAFIDADGSTAAATEGFDALGIDNATLKALVQDVQSERDRLVKRHISGTRRYPAGIARLTDDPALHLLLVVDEGEDSEMELPTQPQAEGPPRTLEAQTPSKPVTTDAVQEEPQLSEADHPPEEDASRVEADERPVPRTVRFAWHTDAEGRFTSISQKFVDAVGEASGDVVGRTFKEVSSAFGLDPDGAIARLMERRDTWSGRTVMWPLADSRDKIPVDLAALPAYGRGHVFEGFRGFGVARLGEAKPETTEISPTAPQNGESAAETSGAAETSDAPEQDVVDTPAEDDSAADPFLGEERILAISATPDRRKSDKIIRLAEHREIIRDIGLTTSERTAFREIGDRLRRANELLANRVKKENEPAETRKTDENVSVASVPANDTGQAPDDLEESAREESTSERRPEELPRRSELFKQKQAQPGFLPSAFAVIETTTDINLLSKLPLPILIHSGDELHYANRELLRLTGYADLAALETAGGIDALFDEREESPSNEEAPEGLRLRTSQGETLAVEAHLQSVPWKGRKALMLALHPVEEKEPQEPINPEVIAELKTRLDEMRTIVDTATDGIATISSDGMIRSINRPAEALFGFDAEHVIGKPFTSLFAIESQSTVEDYLNALADNGVASVLNDGRQVIGREAQGRFIPLFITIGGLPNGNGYCAVLRDVTSWKRTEEELTQARAQAEHASAQKSDFLARVSHEIRTPLNAIIGFSELMIDEKFGPISNDRYRDYLRDINRSGNHVLDLVNDLLDISKIEAGQQEMQFEAVSLNDTLGQVVAMMQPQANSERVIIRSSFASRLPEVVADLRTIRQIAFNLLSNAVRFTPAGGQVIVSTAYSSEGSVVLRVRDTGVGMSSAELDEALKPFKQINALRRKHSGGTGLGLPLTRAMVEANRARFFITSTPSEGTLVEITFPSTRVLAD